jgi:hypothetical protein
MAGMAIDFKLSNESLRVILGMIAHELRNLKSINDCTQYGGHYVHRSDVHAIADRLDGVGNAGKQHLDDLADIQALYDNKDDVVRKMAQIIYQTTGADEQ